MGEDSKIHISQEELKPCPFCGGTSLKIDSRCNGRHKHGAKGGTYTVSIRCNKCHARGGTASGTGSVGLREAEERAIDNWNWRLPEMEMNL